MEAGEARGRINVPRELERLRDVIERHVSASSCLSQDTTVVIFISTAEVDVAGKACL